MNAYEQLCGLAQEIVLVGSAASVLGWDQETYMPEKGLKQRARQLSYLSAKAHELATGKRFRTLLEKAEKEEVTSGSTKAANLREWRHEIERASRIPTKMVAEESDVTSHAKHAWADARKRSDFSLFAPHLAKIVQLARKKADLWGFSNEPYDALLTGYERGALTRDIAQLFGTLKPKVAQIAQVAVERSSCVPKKLLHGKYPVLKQQQLNREIAESIGFDFDAGRIDTTTHPFCTTLGPADVRLTTRYDESDFTSSLFGVLHEVGHGLYEQGLPESDFGLPSGTAVSLGIHESQSRLWENHVGRSLPFWEKWLPRAAELFPNLRKVELADFMRAIHRAEFSFIRVEADEATYDLHIMLRFEIERRLLAGTLEVNDVPKAWNESYAELFGQTPPDDARGCLQDIHWSMGGLGYFATYTLGNLNSAQLFQCAQKVRSISAATKRSDYGPLLVWLREKVHAKGSTLFPGDLMVSATGKVTDSAPYLAHLRSRFTR
ncbi:MAG: carboxypeptidase M32 [Verrucomicrobiota bacterium]